MAKKKNIEPELREWRVKQKRVKQILLEWTIHEKQMKHNNNKKSQNEQSA